MKTIILASNSKARYNLLTEAGYNTIVRSTNIEETSEKTKPEELVQDLAKQKLDAYFKQYGNKNSEIIIAADTMIYHNNQLIGKVKDKIEAYQILKKLSNKNHQIYSGFAMYIPNQGISIGYDSVDIYFKKLTDLTIINYLILDEWKDAAGAYRIQGIGCSLIKDIKGDINVAVGLPLNKISALIKAS